MLENTKSGENGTTAHAAMAAAIGNQRREQEQKARGVRRENDLLQDQLDDVGKGLQEPGTVRRAIRADAYLHVADHLAFPRR